LTAVIACPLPVNHPGEAVANDNQVGELGSPVGPQQIVVQGLAAVWHVENSFMLT